MECRHTRRVDCLQMSLTLYPSAWSSQPSLDLLARPLACRPSRPPTTFLPLIPLSVRAPACRQCMARTISPLRYSVNYRYLFGREQMIYQFIILYIIFCITKSEFSTRPRVILNSVKLNYNCTLFYLFLFFLFLYKKYSLIFSNKILSL